MPSVGLRGPADDVLLVGLANDPLHELGVVVEPEPDARGGREGRFAVDQSEDALVVVGQHPLHRAGQELVDGRRGRVGVAALGDELQTLDALGEALVDLVEDAFALDQERDPARDRHPERRHEQHRRQDPESN